MGGFIDPFSGLGGFMPQGGDASYPWWLSADELWRMFGMAPPMFFASRPPVFPVSPPASGAPAEPVDPRSGLPQSLVDQLWQINPPEGVPPELLEPHPQFGLPKWIVARAQGFLEQKGWDTNNLPLFFQTIPWNEILAILSPAWTPHYRVDVEEPTPKEPEQPGQPSEPEKPSETGSTPGKYIPPKPPDVPGADWQWNPIAGIWVLVPEKPPTFSVDVNEPPGESPGSPPPSSESPPPYTPPPGEPPQPPIIEEPPPVITPPGPGPGEPPGEQQPPPAGGLPGGILPALAAASGGGVGAPYPGQPAPNVGMLRQLISQFLIPAYIPTAIQGLRRK